MTQYIGAVPESAKQEVIRVDQTQSKQNLLINSDFAVNQRAYVSGTATAAGSFMYDRWASDLANTSMTLNGIEVTLDNSTGGTAGQAYQGIEAGALIEGKQYTVSWKGTAQASVYYANGGVNSFRDSPFTFTAPAPTGNVHEYITISGDGATISELKLEEGTSATPWEKPDVATELNRCMRYYERLDINHTRFLGWSVNWYHSTATTAVAINGIRATVPKRALGTVSGTNLQYRINNSRVTLTSVSLNLNNDLVTVHGTAVAAAGTPGDTLPMESTATTVLTFDAEL